MKRRRLVALVAFGMPLVVWGAACTFPDVTFGGAEAEAGPGGLDGGDEGSTEPPLPEDVDPEGGTKEASTAGDANVAVDASGCAALANPCDCDEDGYDRLDLDAGCDGGGVMRGVDCDDLIPAIHPNQQADFLNDKWVSTYRPAGDWDCDGVTIKQYVHSLNCALKLDCTGAGFATDPECGFDDSYFECRGAALLCSGADTGRRIQGCR